MPPALPLHYRPSGRILSLGRYRKEIPLARAPEIRSDVHREWHKAALETAARLICEKGYEAASVQDIADACGLTKAGLCYYIRSKEELLLEIMSYGMDIFEERVLLQVLNIGDPVERLKARAD